MSVKPVLVVGAGPVGLMNALYLSRVRKLPVILVEQQAKVGGLYASVPTPWGLADQGVHIPQKTGDQVIDNLLFDVLPHAEWQILEGTHKDIAGNIFAGSIDFGSLYPDLRRLAPEDYLRCAGEIFSNASVSYPSLGEASSLKEYFEARFGKFCTEKVFEPISQKIWRRPLDQMSPWAAKLVHLARVVTHSSEVAPLLKMSPVLDAVIGFPEQLSVPNSMFSEQRAAMYPRKFGLDKIVAGFVRELEHEGVQLMTSSDVIGIDADASGINTVNIKDGGNGSLKHLDVSAVVWTSPVQPLMKLLGAPALPLPDAPIAHRVVHFFLDTPPETGLLYWLWSYDPEDCLVRVSSPHAYCADAVKDGVYPLCAELHIPDVNMDDEAVIKLAEAQLRLRNIIGPTTRVMGGVVLKNIRAFFVPTLENVQLMNAQRRTVESVQPSNLIIATQDLNAGIFYMPDILCAGKSQLDKLSN